jgi:hypothetical protein
MFQGYYCFSIQINIALTLDSFEIFDNSEKTPVSLELEIQVFK